MIERTCTFGSCKLSNFSLLYNLQCVARFLQFQRIFKRSFLFLTISCLEIFFIICKNLEHLRYSCYLDCELSKNMYLKGLEFSSLRYPFWSSRVLPQQYFEKLIQKSPTNITIFILVVRCFFVSNRSVLSSHHIRI